MQGTANLPPHSKDMRLSKTRRLARLTAYSSSKDRAVPYTLVLTRQKRLCELYLPDSISPSVLTYEMLA